MQEFIQMITREDAYNIVVPVGVLVLSWVLQFATGYINKEKQWRQIKEKSSSDSFSIYFLLIFWFGAVWLAIYIASVFFIEKLWEIKLGSTFIKISYTVFSIFPYVLFIKNIQKKDIVLKRKYKYEKEITNILSKLPIILAGIMWSCIFFKNANSIMKIDIALMLIFELFYLNVLDRNKKIKYQYASFLFYSGGKIENILIDKIHQKGNWITAEDELSGIEHRFRIKDIEKVEYKNWE